MSCFLVWIVRHIQVETEQCRFMFVYRGKENLSGCLFSVMDMDQFICGVVKFESVTWIVEEETTKTHFKNEKPILKTEISNLLRILPLWNSRTRCKYKSIDSWALPSITMSNCFPLIVYLFLETFEPIERLNAVQWTLIYPLAR